MTQKDNQKLYFELMIKIRELGEPICSLPENQDLFFAEVLPGNESNSVNEQARKDQNTAISLCNVCAVRSACADYAITAQESHGIWGGLTPVQRQKINKSRYKPVEKD